ncbi:MAG: glycosyltransferase family 1 protein [Flavobacteriales bacterium]|nr:glycosyltransferase family 1 protein [Flavobacteriales bacterium]
MKIGFDAKRAFLNTTGLGNYSRDAIRVLSHFFPENKYFLFTPKEHQGNNVSFLNARANTFTRTPKSFMSVVFKSYWRSKRVVKDLVADKIDLFHGLSHELPLGIEKTDIKTVVSIHDLIFIRYPHLFRAIDRKIYYKKFKSACDRSDKIIAVSNQTKQDIIEFFGIPEEKIVVVYQGCNDVFHHEVSAQIKRDVQKKYNLPEDYILSVGSIEERKNLLTILKTLLELPHQKLVVIGDGKDYKMTCDRFIDTHNLSDRVLFLNGIDSQEMAAVYQNAQMLIYPSIFEGFGIPILEALFSKTPVISSKEGCFVEAGGSYTKYIDPLSVHEMKEAVLDIQHSTDLQNTMISKGFEYAQNFTDRKIATNLFQVYNSLLDV